MLKKLFYIYILASKPSGTLYVGITNDLKRRVWEHKNDLVEGFTKKYKIHSLVYFEQAEDIDSAYAREEQLKHWNRAWKIRLIRTVNPGWKDLFEKL